MRGTLILQLLYKCCYRIIPAHAGNSRIPSRWFTRTADHPRACGELLRPGMAPGWLAGSSPAHAGNSSRDTRTGISSTGSSPRMRGTPRTRIGERGERQIGSSPRMRGTRGEHHPVSVVLRSDHPRACGELLPHPRVSQPPFGSSPRMRGTPIPRGFRFGVGRIIPAHAGNSWP